MKTKLFSLFAVVIVFVACDKNSVYNKLDRDFENSRWQSDDVKTFEFVIEDDSKMYNIDLQFSHIYDYQYATVPLEIKMTAPDGKEEQIPFELQIKDASGKQLSDCTGDMCDLVVPMKENLKLAKGTYKITVGQKFKIPYLPNVLALGVNVKTVE
ncbi:hypothetical protein [Flavobacterium sp.]|uniref:hypothetical protein n=1 Tax=Flavobacterium sp. TaxID=239 RepID=UPI0028BE7B78|nr:hypothetical protein [Flavobacterium sp.]